MPKNLKVLFCYNNILTALPILPDTLKDLYISDNNLTHIPILPKNLKKIYFDNNIIYDIVNSDDLNIVKRNINTINRFRHLYYCIKFRAQFRKYLWERVRGPKII